MRGVVARFLFYAPFDYLQQSHLTRFERPDLRFKIGAPLVVAANIGQNQLHHVIADLATTHDSNRWDTYAFSINICSQTH